MPPTPLDLALSRLPHGPEFRFLDHLTHLQFSPTPSATATYHIRGAEPFLAAHFPGHPLMPGVLMIEALAQLAGVIAQSDPATPPSPNLRLTAIRNAKILDSAQPGETLLIECSLTGKLGNLIQASGSVHAGARTLVRADLTLARLD